MVDLRYNSGQGKLWQQLRDKDPGDIQQRSGSSYRDGVFTLCFMDRQYRIDPLRECLEASPEDPLAGDPEFELLLLSSLLHNQDIPSAERWISEKELPGGSNFFRGPHQLSGIPLVKRYGDDLAGFNRSCAALGGKRIDYGDAAYAFQALPRIPVACLLWVKDEEFPARTSFLFDSTIEYQLPLDIILALVHSLVLLLAKTDPG